MAEQQRNRLVDTGLALGAFALALLLLAVEDTDDVRAGAVALTALSTLPLVARRRAPLAVFVLTTLASCALVLVAPPAGPPIGPTIALYGLASQAAESPAGTPRTLAVVVLMFALHLAAGGVAEDGFPWTALLFGVLLWGGVWLAGERGRMRRDRLRQLEERALRAEREAERERRLAAAEERMRIARDLHDSAGHAINVILVHAGLGRLRTESDPEGARAALETIEEVARETVGEIDQLVEVLREQAAAEGEVEPPPGVAAVDALIARHRAAGLDVTATVTGPPCSLPPTVDRTAYRIMQEALTNAARHGGGGAEVELAYRADAVELTVTNALRGESGRGADGHGLVGMRERVALVGGRLHAGAQDGRFRVHAHLPLAGRPG